MHADSMVPFPEPFHSPPTPMVPRLRASPFHQGANVFFSAIIKARRRQRSCLVMARCTPVYSFVCRREKKKKARGV